MGSTARWVLAAALLQTLLATGTAVLVSGVNEERSANPPGAGRSQTTPSSALSEAAPIGEGPHPGSAPAPGAPSPSGGDTPSSRPAAATAPGPEARRYPIISRYDKLTDEEGRHVAGGPLDEPLIEGRLNDSETFWRLSGHERPGGICMQMSFWSEAGGGSGGSSDCPPNKEWTWAAGGPKGRWGVHGFAPANAERIRLVGQDGSAEQVQGVHRPDMGVTFFAAWITCEAPNLARFEAWRGDELLSTYTFPGEFGFPEFACRD